MKQTARILLGVVFILSAIAKLSSMEGFELYIFSFGFFSFDFSSLAARILIIAEFLLGAGMASGILYRFSRLMTALFLAFFSIFLIWRSVIGDTESCHCMGDIVDMNPVQSLIKNAVLSLLLFIAWKSPYRVFKFEKIISLSITLGSLLAVFLISPPDLFYRKGRVSQDLVMEKFCPVADSLGLDEGKKIVCFYSGSCEHCMNSASKMASIIRRHELPSERISVVFMQTHQNQDSVAVNFFQKHGEGLVLSYSYLHPYSFLPMTNGSMPLVVLIEDGNLVMEYDYLSLDERKIVDFIGQN